MIGGLVPIAGGVLASSGFIISKKPNAKELIDKLVPYQGWIAAVMFGWVVWETISFVLNVGLFGQFPLRMVFWLLVAISDLLVGFLLGYGLITKYAMGSNEAAKQKGAAVRAKLVKVQAPLGLLAIVMGVLYLVWLYAM